MFRDKHQIKNLVELFCYVPLAVPVEDIGVKIIFLQIKEK